MVDTARLSALAKILRQDIIKMIAQAGSGHPASALGLADLFTALYWHILKKDPQRPFWSERDYLLMSNGHAGAVWYAALARTNYFSDQELKTFRHFHSRLSGHPHYRSLPGIENTSGSLGQGLSQAAGIALGLKMDRRPNRVYAILSDAEHQEGQTWEAYMFAAKYHLDNLIAFIDLNKIQISGQIEQVMPIKSLKNKISAFNWQVFEIDGHSFPEIINTVDKAKLIDRRPTAIVCHTIPGKGVSFMENDYRWHGQALNQSQLQQALKELDKK